MLGMLAVTYLPRLLPLLLLASRPLPPLVIAWLRYVPVTVLSALLLPSLLVQDGQIAVGHDNLFLWAAFPTIVVVWKTKSFLGAVLTGVGSVAIARYLLGV